MTDDLDKGIAELMRRDAPAARDPLFRVQVLERLETARYRRRLQALIACAVVFAVVAVIGAGAGGPAREATGVLLVGAALLAVYFVVAPAMAQLFMRFGGSSKKI